MNFVLKFISFIKFFIFVIDLGFLVLIIVLILDFVGLILCVDNKYFINFNWGILNLYFLLFKVKFFCCNFCSSFLSFLLCCWLFLL